MLQPKRNHLVLPAIESEVLEGPSGDQRQPGPCLQARCFHSLIGDDLSKALAFYMCFAQSQGVKCKREARAFQFLLSNHAALFLACTIKNGQFSLRDQQLI